MSTPAPSSRPPRITVELLLAVAATLLSLGALLVSVVQTRIAREQQHAAVWPFLRLGSGIVDARFTFQLENKGVGPALIRRVEVHHRGRPYPSHVALLNGQLLPAFGGSRFHVALQPGDVLKAGEELKLFEIDGDRPSAQRLDDLVDDEQFTMRITYADVYGNCWVATQRKVDPASCPDGRTVSRGPGWP